MENDAKKPISTGKQKHLLLDLYGVKQTVCGIHQ